MTFESDWEKAKTVIVKASEQVVRATALEIFSSIIKASPVDTGRFRGNWQTTIAKPANGVLDDFPGEAGTLTAAEQVIARFKLAQKSLFLTNNLPYAERLANGWSKQRPSGWIESIIGKFQSTVDKAAREHNLK